MKTGDINADRNFFQVLINGLTFNLYLNSPNLSNITIYDTRDEPINDIISPPIIVHKDYTDEKLAIIDFIRIINDLI